MPAYDAAHFDPPAPVAVVTIRDAITRRSVPDVPLLLDTGSDVTLLPRSALDELGVSPLAGDGEELIAIDGTRSVAPVFVLDVIVLSRVFRGRYLAIDAPKRILGRDVLNHVAVLLDGPRQAWTEHAP